MEVEQAANHCPVVCSSGEVSLCGATKEALYLRQLLGEMGFQQPATNRFEDSQLCNNIAVNAVTSFRTKLACAVEVPLRSPGDTSHCLTVTSQQFLAEIFCFEEVSVCGKCLRIYLLTKVLPKPQLLDACLQTQDADYQPQLLDACLPTQDADCWVFKLLGYWD